MWIVKSLFFLALLFALVLLVAQNQQAVDVDLFGRDFLGISIFWVVAVCYAAGLATVLVFSAFREFRFHREVRALKKTLRKRDQELADLRTLPLRDEVGAAAATPARKEATGD